MTSAWVRDAPATSARTIRFIRLLLRESVVTTVAVSLRFECGDDQHQGEPDQACISRMFAAANNSPTRRQVTMTSFGHGGIAARAKCQAFAIGARTER
jgi:hypothetical protein